MSKSLSKKAAMAKGALHAVLKPKFAADAMPDLNAILTGVSRKNWLIKKPGIIAALKPAFATDADLETLVELLDSMDDAESDDDDLSMDDDGKKAVSEILDALRGKISDEDLTMVEQKLNAMAVPVAHITPGAANDEPPAFPGKPAVGKGPEGESAAEKDADKVSKSAMDAAIKVAVKQAEDAAIARIRGVQEAERVVTPYVGKLAMACDSEEDVYKAALKLMNVKTKGIHPSAFRAFVEAQPLPGSGARQIVAQDSAQPAALAKFLADHNLPA